MRGNCEIGPDGATAESCSGQCAATPCWWLLWARGSGKMAKPSGSQVPQTCRDRWGAAVGPPRGRRSINARQTIVVWAGEPQSKSEIGMHVFNITDEQEFNPARHIEKMLGRVADGDISIACWEPDQISPYHCHPSATEIYFCFQGGGVMRTPDRAVELTRGSFVIHPPGELHEYANGSERTLLFRVRYGNDMSARSLDWRGNADWKQRDSDSEYFRQLRPTDRAGPTV